MAKNFWLVKQEPEAYSWSTFLGDGKTAWTGVRNFQARNNLRAMKKGDLVFYYHSVSEKSVVGLARVEKESYPDPTATEGTPAAVGAARLAGAATGEATSTYARRQGAGDSGYGPLGRTGLVCSRIGFGGYRVDDETAEHREALSRALLSGCNLIDTSTNYTDGGSETLVGDVLADLARRGRLGREEVIVVSKIGYVQGANLELAQRRETEGRPFPEVVKYGEGVWHCMHPEFLADQLPRSLARLQVEALDVCLLHNPEYYLSDAHERSEGKLERRREEFYRRLPGSARTASRPTPARGPPTTPSSPRSPRCSRRRKQREGAAITSACCSFR